MTDPRSNVEIRFYNFLDTHNNERWHNACRQALESSDVSEDRKSGVCACCLDNCTNAWTFEAKCRYGGRPTIIHLCQSCRATHNGRIDVFVIECDYLVTKVIPPSN